MFGLIFFVVVLFSFWGMNDLGTVVALFIFKWFSTLFPLFSLSSSSSSCPFLTLLPKPPPAPPVRRVAPRFSILPMSHEIMPGGNVNITCVAVGSPMPYVKWMQGAEDLTPEDDMPVGRNVLELTDVKDSANYTCVAMSSLGVIEAVAQITVKCKLGPQRGCHGRDTSLTLTPGWAGLRSSLCLARGCGTHAGDDPRPSELRQEGRRI